MLFSGADNSIYLEQEYYEQFSCDFNLEFYPFDIQVGDSGWQCDIKTLISIA